MKNLGLSHYNLRAPRAVIDALQTFYCEVVGLELGPRPLSSYGYWLYAGGRDVLHLSETRPGQDCVQNVQTPFDHVAFACTGVADYEALLIARGIHYRRADPDPGCVQLFFNDPAGNGIELNFVGVGDTG